MKKIKEFTSKNYISILFALTIFIWFFFISSKTTLAGDDWAFYNNAIKDGIIDSAIGMYYGWEGRLMTLFSIHTLILNINLWKIVNSLIYPIIFLISINIVKPKSKILYSLIFIFLILSIKDNIRMEVFSWITGSVYYAIPLLVSFIYFGINFVILEKNESKINPILFLISILCAFYLPLGMENIAVAGLVLTLFLNIIFWMKNKKFNLLFIINLIVFIISYIIWLNSPGSSIRLTLMPDWQKLTFMGKIIQTLPNVLFFTFFQNKYLIIMLSSSLIFHNYINNSGLKRFLFLPIYMISIFIMFSQRILVFLPNNQLLAVISDGYSLFNIIFWILFAITLIVNIVQIDISKKQFRLSIFLIMAIFSSAPLLMSPVIGYRLMIYTYIYLVIIVLLLINYIEINNHLIILFTCSLLLISLFLANKLIEKYNLVQSITEERIAIIQDYYVYSDLYKDGIWLPRYPIYTIHGGDIEIDDQYHMLAFKQYFKIPLDEKITFYWKEKY